MRCGRRQEGKEEEERREEERKKEERRRKEAEGEVTGRYYFASGREDGLERHRVIDIDRFGVDQSIL